MTKQLRVFSYGGGVQSTAALVLAAQKQIDFPTFLFSNVGEDSEHPATLQYIREVAMPYAEEQEIELREVRYTKRNGDQPTLYGEVMRPDNKSTDIPMRLGDGKAAGMPLKRICTNDFKISVIDKELRRRGATKTEQATIGIGISLDEFERMSTPFDPRQPYRTKEYPLIDLRLDRQDCINIIERAGLPTPPKSSCYFCPFHSTQVWRKQSQEEPELFKKSVAIEEEANRRRAALGMGPVYMSRHLISLIELVAVKQFDMFDEQDDTCESGYCMV